MFREEIDMAGNAAKKKIQFLRQQTGAYFISAMLAGMFVGFGVLLAFTAGGMLKEGGVPGVKFIMGGCFGVALSLVLMAGAELFTGSNFVMAVGMFQKKVTFQDSVTVWVTCWLGNLAGSVLVAGMYSLTGLCTGSVQAIMADTLMMIGLLNPAQYDISIGGYAYNLAVVTIGNMVGGILFLAVPYFLIGKEKAAKN